MFVVYYCVFTLISLAYGQQMGQQFGSSVVNEGDKNCAQFWYAPNSLSAKCLVHKLTLEVNRFESYAITLSGLENPEFTGNTEITYVINNCRATIAVSCIQEQYCTVDYMNNGFKRSTNAGFVRFVVNGDQISGELARNKNSNPSEFYRCVSQSMALNMTRSRHEVYVYLERAFPGHNFEIHDADVQRYRNGQSIYTEQETRPEINTPYQSTTFVPFAETSTEPSAVDIFRSRIFQTTTQFPSFYSTEASIIVEDLRRMELKKQIDDQLKFQQNSGVTVERMQRSSDGKHLLLDLVIRTRVEVPTNFV